MKIIKFIICGDTGFNNDIQKENLKFLSSSSNLNYDYMLLLGDNFYPSGLEDIKQFKPLFVDIFPNVPCFAILGNHDYLSDPITQIQVTKSGLYPNWKMPYFFYDTIFHIDQETIHFIFIDSCILGHDLTSRLLNNTRNKHQFESIHKSYYELHLEWLKKVLSNSKSKWKIVCGHYPIYSNGPHQTSLQLSTLLLPLLERYKVDCYLSGHDHNLQHIEQNGIHFLISGSFSDSYLPGNRYPNSFKTKDCGFLKLVVEGDDLLHFTFMSPNNPDLHSFTLTKNQRITYRQSTPQQTSKMSSINTQSYSLSNQLLLDL